MPSGGSRIGSGKPRKRYEYDDGRWLTLLEIMELTGLKYAQAYRKYAQKLGIREPKRIVRSKTIGKPPMSHSSSSFSEELNTELEKKDPLQYMLDVMNNPLAPPDRRDKMAVAAAQYMHKRAGQASKKEKIAEKASDTARTSKFTRGEAPKIIQGGRK